MRLFLQIVSSCSILAVQQFLAAELGETRHTARLIVVDDQPAFRKGLRALLRGAHDLQVVGEASTGREALDLCRELRPELVLLDLHLPDMDGFSVARAIMQRSPTIRIVMLTLDENPSYRAEADSLGLHGYVLKGVRRGELLAVVRHSLLK